MASAATSKGGLDARRLMHTNADVGKRVATVIMIGTPHLGSPVADLANAANVLKLIPDRGAQTLLVIRWSNENAAGQTRGISTM